ncbi:MAG: hypothetical protein GY756_02830 [bacterium]|nr:hypothetical protein [bacterium]
MENKPKIVKRPKEEVAGKLIGIVRDGEYIEYKQNNNNENNNNRREGISSNSSG